ncbi:zf-HC2 domain-containing protein [Mycobacterium sp. SMC-16]|uniref:zf-HC2 domain-containing protein n=1 Tax=Mycobacteriaceae TaxID=1762 RepID=UPI000FAB4933|nr:zf-HC2 domain-containing protein [Mycolicibacterium sp.]RUP33105.1 MAG: zf-HC2 domain-containing protein [Mycolicibacterium sp.]TXH27193.1 MAG: zf-HC2 domain-containing protein [Mycobacterium sp.]
MTGNDDDFVGNDLRITCADAVSLVTDYLEDALAESDLERFAQHTAGCEACRVFVDQVRRTIRIAVATRDESVEMRPANFDALLAEFRRFDSN